MKTFLFMITTLLVATSSVQAAKPIVDFANVNQVISTLTNSVIEEFNKKEKLVEELEAKFDVANSSIEREQLKLDLNAKLTHSAWSPRPSSVKSTVYVNAYDRNKANVFLKAGLSLGLDTDVTSLINYAYKMSRTGSTCSKQRFSTDEAEKACRMAEEGGSFSDFNAFATWMIEIRDLLVVAAKKGDKAVDVIIGPINQTDIKVKKNGAKIESLLFINRRTIKEWNAEFEKVSLLFTATKVKVSFGVKYKESAASFDRYMKLAATELKRIESGNKEEIEETKNGLRTYLTLARLVLFGK